MSDGGSQVTGRAAELRDAFDRVFAEAHPPAPPPSEDLLAIRIASEPYALRLTEIAGLFADRKITPVAGRVSALLGIAGFRGLIVPVYDLQVLLGCPPLEDGALARDGGGNAGGVRIRRAGGPTAPASERDRLVPDRRGPAPARSGIRPRDGPRASDRSPPLGTRSN